MKYSTSTLVRAAIAGLLAAAGAAGAASGDLGALDWVQVLSMIGTGVVSATALLRSPVKESVTDRAISSVQDVVVKTTEANEKLTQQAIDSIQRVQAAVGDLSGILPSMIPSAPPLDSPEWKTVYVPSDWQRPVSDLAQQALDAVGL